METKETKVCKLCNKSSVCAADCGKRCESCHCKGMVVRILVLTLVIALVAIASFHAGAYRGFMEAGGSETGWEQLKTKIHGE